MRYKNIKTGVVIETTSVLVGDVWVPESETEKVPTEEKTEEYIEDEIDLEKMTNSELEKFAKEHGIELTSDDKKNKATRIDVIAKAFE